MNTSPRANAGAVSAASALLPADIESQAPVELVELTDEMATSITAKIEAENAAKRQRRGIQLKAEIKPVPTPVSAHSAKAQLDIKDVAARAIPHLEAICAHWLPDGKRLGHDWVALNPTRDDQTPGSFSVSLLTGGCIDHATGDQCHDIVSTVRYLDGLQNQAEAARKVAEFLGTAPLPDPAQTPTPTKSAPKAMKTRPTAHPKLGKPSAQWDYLDADKRLLCAVLRFETPTGKEFRPITRTPDGWVWKAPSEPRPLYGLDRLAARPDAPVILAEGEKAANAAGVLLPDGVHIASMNGAKSPKRSDWSPLQGRRVLIWPDADEPGAQFAQAAAKLILDAGAQSVEVLDLSSLADDLPPGWDAADALSEGWTPERFAEEARFIKQPSEAFPKKFQHKLETSYTSDPSATRVSSLRDTSAIPPEVGSIPPDGFQGALTYANKKGETKCLIDSHAASAVAEHLHGRVAWDAEAGAWLIWSGTHWEPLAIATRAEKLIADTVDEGCHPIGYRVGYLTGITQIITRRHLLAVPEWPTGVVPFENGLLDLETRLLKSAAPERALDWCLPWQWDPKADCPTIKAWLKRSVNGQDADTVELLRAWLAALLRGLELQYFLTLIGRGGSGKGTFQRLAAAVVGIRNVAITDLARLETNRFETAKLYGKRLCMVNEAGKHGGSVDVLKAVTGGDHIPLERKHQQQSGSFRFRGLVLMATNEPIIATDSTSGLERRRITVRFPYSATAEEKAEWDAKGGEQAVLHAEIPGLIRWLLDMPVAEIKARLSSLPSPVVNENLLGMAAGNSVAEWLVESCVPVANDTHGTQIGVKSSSAEFCLYPNYLNWCDETGRNHPVSIRKFSDTVTDIAEHLGHALRKDRGGETRAAYLFGLRLRAGTEEHYDWTAVRKRPTGSPTAPGKADDKEVF